MVKKDPHWIEHAHIKKGIFAAKAHKAGLSTHAYAEKEKHAGGKLGKEASLALTFEKLHHRK